MYENIKKLEYVAASDVSKANNLLKEGWLILNTFQEKCESNACGYILFGKKPVGYEDSPKLQDEI